MSTLGKHNSARTKGGGALDLYVVNSFMLLAPERGPLSQCPDLTLLWNPTLHVCDW